MNNWDKHDRALVLPFLLLLLVLLQSLPQRVRTGVRVLQGNQLLPAHGLLHTINGLLILMNSGFSKHNKSIVREVAFKVSQYPVPHHPA